MITNIGKNILAKYLVGHTPSYASHIAIGCGAEPLFSDEFINFYAQDFAQKETLDFEMFRVPIISRGFVGEDGISYIVFTAELPTQERYEITEVGVFSAASNPIAGLSDSKMLYSFSELEGWEYHTSSAVRAIDSVRERLDTPSSNIISVDSPGISEGSRTKSFFADSDNVTFAYPDRQGRNEVPRFLNNSLFVLGNSAALSQNSLGNLVANEDLSDHVHLTGVSLGLDRNSPTDLLKLAFSVVNEQGEDPLDPEGEEVVHPSGVRILVEFASGETGNDEFARMEIDLADGENGVDLKTNRYFVITKQIQELKKSIGFSWDKVGIIKVYCSVLFGIDKIRSDRFWIALDGLRLENVSSINPLYGLTGYTVVQTPDGLPIKKTQNSSNFVEFRFGFDTDVFDSEES
jgi:hypothetical protein